jgi:hypothetical protein
MRKYLDIISGVTEDKVVAESASRTNRLQGYLDDVLNEGYTSATVKGLNVEEFVRGYMEAILFTSNDEATPEGGEPLNKNFTPDDFSHEAMDRIHADCRTFLHSAGPWLTVDRHRGALLSSLEAHAGHDFWLTRCGHGAGFWDGDWEGEDDGRFDGPLTKRAKAFGNLDVVVGDDGKLHLV